MARVVVVGGGFGGLAVGGPARQARPRGHAARARGHARRRARSRRARRVRVGRRADVHAAAGRGARPVPQVRAAGRARARPGRAGRAARAPVRGRHLGPAAGGSRAAQIAAVDELGAGLGARWVDHVDVLRRRLGGAAPRLPRAPVGPRPPARAAGRAARQPRDAGASGCETFKDERLRLVAAHPFVADGHDPRDVPAWVGRDVVRRAAVRRVDGARRAWRALADGAGRPAGDPQGRRAHRHRGPRPRGARRPGGGGRHGRRRARRRRRGRRARPAPAARAGAVTCGARCRRCRRSSATSASRATLPDLAHETVLHGDPMLVVRTGGRAPDGAPRGRCTAAAASPRTSCVALARHGIDVRPQVVTRVDRSPRDLVEQWGGSPLGVLWQGRRRRSGGSGRRRPSPVCTPPARTRRPAPGCRSSGCRPRWSPRWSVRPDRLDRPARRSPSAPPEIVVSPGAMAIDLASRMPPARSAIGARRRAALGHRLHLAQPGAGELGEVLGAGDGVGVRRLAGLARARPGRRPRARALDLQPVADGGRRARRAARRRRRGRRRRWPASAGPRSRSACPRCRRPATR